MHWDAYTVCSVLSGAILVLLGLAPIGAKPKDRFGCLAGGAAFIAYGVYVARQTSGFFVFSPAIFVIPVIAIAYLVVLAFKNLADKPGGAVQWSTGRSATTVNPAVSSPRAQPSFSDHRPDVDPARTGNRPVTADIPSRPSPALSAPVTVYCEECGAPLDKLAKFCTGCGQRQPEVGISR